MFRFSQICVYFKIAKFIFNEALWTYTFPQGWLLGFDRYFKVRDLYLTKMDPGRKLEDLTPDEMHLAILPADAAPNYCTLT